LTLHENETEDSIDSDGWLDTWHAARRILEGDPSVYLGWLMAMQNDNVPDDATNRCPASTTETAAQDVCRGDEHLLLRRPNQTRRSLPVSCRVRRS
jgi:hypothetical protein